MSILEKLKKLAGKRPGIEEFCIETIRFRKLLENAHSVLELFEDGKEKLLGEYILDRHYVTLLIDSVIERLGMVAYDACVLAPNCGEELYAGYDEHKLKAENLHGAKELSRKNEGEVSDLAEPEYRLLSSVLEWLDGETSTPMVMEFMRRAFSCAIKGLASIEALKSLTMGKVSGSIQIIDLWKDVIAMHGSERLPNDLCLPLKFLLMDASSRRKIEETTWLAAVSECQLSLISLKPDFKFRLETTASGDEKSDFIFVFADRTVDVKSILPKKFHMEKAEYGWLAWNSTTLSAIEDTLISIGRNLFTETKR